MHCDIDVLRVTRSFYNIPENNAWNLRINAENTKHRILNVWCELQHSYIMTNCAGDLNLPTYVARVSNMVIYGNYTLLFA